ncbi:hypothetical protein EYC84_001933 [Monilinia fructicola]|uniref:Uncharacterized protein n=1 Tax=Monilinia fructicola TaxID=38448 RepID=A0A5M9JVU3_MONFR|nr:hypothetical protein EYC84_001933 [Monilinia fructicola]
MHHVTSHPSSSHRAVARYSSLPTNLQTKQIQLYFMTTDIQNRVTLLYFLSCTQHSIYVPSKSKIVSSTLIFSSTQTYTSTYIHTYIHTTRLVVPLSNTPHHQIIKKPIASHRIASHRDLTHRVGHEQAKPLFGYT